MFAQPTKMNERHFSAWLHKKKVYDDQLWFHSFYTKYNFMFLFEYISRKSIQELL